MKIDRISLKYVLYAEVINNDDTNNFLILHSRLVLFFSSHNFFWDLSPGPHSGVGRNTSINWKCDSLSQSYGLFMRYLAYFSYFLLCFVKKNLFRHLATIIVTNAMVTLNFIWIDWSIQVVNSLSGWIEW